jgi:hypothetical protein
MSIINLLPEDYIHRSVKRRMNYVFSALFAIVLGAVSAAVLVSEQSSRYRREVSQNVEEAYTQAAMQLKQLQQLEARKQNMIGKAESISSLLERVPRSHLLAIIANSMPECTSLTRVDMDTKKVFVPTPDPKTATKLDSINAKAVTKPKPSLVALDVTGLAGTDVEVARMIARLARNPLIASVDLVYSQEKAITQFAPTKDAKEAPKEIGKVTMREFQIHMELRADADAIQDMNESVASVAEDAAAKAKE